MSTLKTNRAAPEFRAAALAFFFEQVVEQSTWIATILYAYKENGTRTAGIYISLMLLIAAVASPIQARLLERFRPFSAATVQLGGGAIVSFLAAALVLSNAPSPLSWIGLGLIVCAATTAPATLFGLIPSTARDAESLAIQNAQMGWMESAALIVGPVAAAGVLSLTTIQNGLVTLTILGGVLQVAGRQLLRRYRGVETVAARVEATADGDHVVQKIGSNHSEFALLRMPTLQTLVLLTLGSYLSIGALDVLYVPVAAAAGMSEKRSGFLAGAYGMGALLSFVAARRVVGRPRLILPLVAVGAVGSLAIAALSLTEGRVVAAFLLVAVAGAARSIFSSLHRVLLQRSAPAGSLLRVAGIFQVVVTLGFAAGVLVPWLAGSTARACVATGLLLPLSMLAAIRGLGKVDDAANVPVTEIALLRQVGIFRSLPPESLENLARESTIKLFTNEPIVREGDIGLEMFVIIDGTVQVTQHDVVGERMLRTMSRGDAFGEIALMRRQPRSATVDAIENVSVLAIPGTNFMSLVGVNEGVAAAVDGLILQRP